MNYTLQARIPVVAFKYEWFLTFRDRTVSVGRPILMCYEREKANPYNSHLTATDFSSEHIAKAFVQSEEWSDKI